jgi:hypothetical protein
MSSQGLVARPRSPAQSVRHEPFPSRLCIHAADDEGREEVEAFIRSIFKARFGAEIRSFAPCLVSLRDGSGAITAAAGYRIAAESPLFLERYLVAPVESVLARHEPVLERAHVVEIGHLASLRPGRGIRLMSLLGVHLAAQNFRWVVGTATSELRRLFDRLGIAPVALGIANPKMLGDEEAAHWGSYYDHRPEVLAGDLQRSLQCLEWLSRRAVA